MKKLFVRLVLTVFLVASFSGFSAAKEYINGIDANFPPFAYVDATGEPAGFDVDSVNWIAKKMGFTVKHVPMDWNGIVASLVNKKIDFIASGLSVTKERAQAIDFTVPYWTVRQLLVVKKDSDLVPEVVLKGEKKLGVQSGTSEAEWLETQAGKNGNNYTLRYYDSGPMAVQDLVIGRIDAAAMNESPAFDAVKKRPVKIIGEMGLAPEEFAYGVRKDDPELKNLLNEGIKLLIADPYWEELIKKYNPNEH